MFRQFAVVSVGLLLTTGRAEAHKLEAKAFPRPFGVVQVEGWFETEEPASNAKVEAFAADGQRIVEGRLNERGVFAFPYDDVKSLRVVVNAGAGHRAETTVSGEELARHQACTVATCVTPSPSPLAIAPFLVPAKMGHTPEPEPLANRRESRSFAGLVIGVGILFGVAGAAMGLRRRWTKPPLNTQSHP